MSLIPNAVKLPESFEKAQSNDDIVASLCEIFKDVIGGDSFEEMAGAFADFIGDFDGSDVLEQAETKDFLGLLDMHRSTQEAVESAIDIYYYDLRKWAVENYGYIEQAINEGIVDVSDFDFHRAIQGGQYVYYIEGMNEVVQCFQDIVEHFQDEIDAMKTKIADSEDA